MVNAALPVVICAPSRNNPSWMGSLEPPNPPPQSRALVLTPSPPAWPPSGELEHGTATDLGPSPTPSQLPCFSPLPPLSAHGSRHRSTLLPPKSGAASGAVRRPRDPGVSQGVRFCWNELSPAETPGRCRHQRQRPGHWDKNRPRKTVAALQYPLHSTKSSPNKALLHSRAATKRGTD